MPPIDLSSTASPAEIAWTLCGALALIVNLGLTWTAWRDYTALMRLGGNGARKIAATTSIFVQGGLTLPQVIAVTIGVISMLTPPVNPNIATPTPLLITTYGLILIELLLVWVALYSHFRRAKLLRYLEQAEATVNASRHAETMTELVHMQEYMQKLEGERKDREGC